MAENDSNDQARVKPDASGKENDATAASRAGAPTSVEHTEPEDAYLTGGQRNLQRRVLGLNVDENAGQAQGHPEQPAGIHSTGSFTGKGERDEDTSK